MMSNCVHCRERATIVSDFTLTAWGDLQRIVFIYFVSSMLHQHPPSPFFTGQASACHCYRLSWGASCTDSGRNVVEGQQQWTAAADRLDPADTSQTVT